MTVYGYARVSTDGQTLDAQVKELRAAGAEQVFREKISGATTDRHQLTRVLERLERGDLLLVTRLDRLARSTRDLLNILAGLAEKKVGFRSLRDAWADTTTAHGRLVLTVLAGLAEFERELISNEDRRGSRTRGGARGAYGSEAETDLAPTEGGHSTTERGEPLVEIARSYPSRIRLFPGFADTQSPRF